MPLSGADQVRHGLVGEQGGHQRAQIGEGLHPRRDRVEPRTLECGWLPQPCPHAVPLPRREHAQPDVSVAASEDGIKILILRPAAPSLPAVSGCRRLALRAERRIKSQHHRVEPGEVDEVADPGAQPIGVGDQRHPRRLDGGGRRRDALGWQHRCPGGGSGAGQRARHRVQHRVGGTPGGPRAPHTEVGDRHRDKPGVSVGELFAGGAVGTQLPRVAAVDEDVGVGGQLEQSPAVVVVSGIEYGGPFVGVVQRERDAHLVERGQHRPARAATRGLDLQDVGAQVGEESRGQIGLAGRQVQHPQPSQQGLDLGHNGASGSGASLVGVAAGIMEGKCPSPAWLPRVRIPHRRC